MNVRDQLEAASVMLEAWAISRDYVAAERLDIRLQAEDLTAAVDRLLEESWGYLAAITGMDLGPEDGRIEVLYHFCQGAAVLTLRLLTPRQTAEVPSICSLIPSASFFERELSEMFGVAVRGTPNTDRLFLPDNWPVGVFPLRKDFKGIGGPDAKN